jgi:DNA anti-recombination protein RmuC
VTLESLLSETGLLTATPEYLARASLLMATIAAFFAFLAFVCSWRRRKTSALTKFDAMQLLRSETDTLKSDGDERERRMVTGLATAIIDRTKDFGAKIDRFVTQIDGRAEIIWDKLKTDLAQLSTDTSQNRDAMRRLVEEKLTDSIAKQAGIARELREELSAGFLNVGRNVSLTLEHSSELQRERLDDVKRALDRNTEQQSKLQESLRMAVENRLDAIRLESSSKLEEMRSTLDEKLQVALETRLHQSFARIGEQLSKVYEQIGEMKTLASSVNGHSPVPANLNGTQEPLESKVA